MAAIIATVAALFAGNHHAVVVHPRCGKTCHHAKTVRHWRRVARPYRPWLRRVRWCESTNRYGVSTGNGFYGAYQFTVRSWHWVGGHGYPHHAEAAEQDYRAVRLLHVQGRGAWPVCGR